MGGSQRLSEPSQCGIPHTTHGKITEAPIAVPEYALGDLAGSWGTWKVAWGEIEANLERAYNLRLNFTPAGSLS